MFVQIIKCTYKYDLLVLDNLVVFGRIGSWIKKSKS